jgi:glycosyltransferase involved in cell wall biosynthesis
MTSILLNRRPVEGPWGGGNLLVKAICDGFKLKGMNVVHDFDPSIETIFMQDPRPGNTGISINEIIQWKSKNPHVKVIHRVNECDARKGTKGLDSFLRECSKHTDFTVFVSNWMRDYHISKGWNCSSTGVIYNGVNTDHFKRREKLDNGKINIVTHHWSSNRMKGFDVYEAIDEFVKDTDFTFTYIGRELGTFKNTKIIPPLFGEELGKELSRYDLYVSGSLWDPGPNHILESIACQIPTYVTSDGGGAVEFAGKDHVFEDLDQLFRIIRSRSYVNNSLSINSWRKCTDQYLDLVRSL